MNSRRTRWIIAIILALAFSALFYFIKILVGGYTQTQTISAVSAPQTLTFKDPDYIPHKAPISGLTVHVSGHIDGSALIEAAGWPPQSISGDVDWSVYHDFFEPSLVLQYSPSKVTAGKLSVSVTFD